MALNGVKTDIVRYQVRVAQGQNPHEREQKRPGGFGRFLSGVGRILGAVAMPLSFLFPPAAIGAAGMYGLSQIGDQAQARSYNRAQEKMMKEQMTSVVFPGLDVGGSAIRPASSYDVDNQIMDVLDARGNTLSEMSTKV